VQRVGYVDLLLNSTCSLVMAVKELVTWEKINKQHYNLKSMIPTVPAVAVHEKEEIVSAAVALLVNVRQRTPL
jgi:hypothetical protein